MMSTTASTNTYQLALLVEFQKIGLTLLVEFGTNTLDLPVNFAIPVVANHMRSLGAQKADDRRSLASLVYLITNTYLLASLIELHKISGSQGS